MSIITKFDYLKNEDSQAEIKIGMDKVTNEQIIQFLTVDYWDSLEHYANMKKPDNFDWKTYKSNLNIVLWFLNQMWDSFLAEFSKRVKDKKFDNFAVKRIEEKLEEKLREREKVLKEQRRN